MPTDSTKKVYVQENDARQCQEIEGSSHKMSTRRPYGIPLESKACLVPGAEDPYESLGRLGEGGFAVVDNVRKRGCAGGEIYARKRIKRKFNFACYRREKQKLEWDLVKEVKTLHSMDFRHVPKIVESYV